MSMASVRSLRIGVTVTAVTVATLAFAGSAGAGGDDFRDLWRMPPLFSGTFDHSGAAVFAPSRRLGLVETDSRDTRHRDADRNPRTLLSGHAERHFAAEIFVPFPGPPQHRFRLGERGLKFDDARHRRFLDRLPSRGYDERGARTNHRSPMGYAGRFRR